MWFIGDIKIMVLSKKNILLLCIFFYLMSLGIMLFNTFSHPAENSYDYHAHMAAIEANKSFFLILPDENKPYRMSYNPPLYYMLSKVYTISTFFCDYNPYYFFRILHIIFLSIIYYLYAFILLPRLLPDKNLLILLFTIMYFVIPGVYLNQLMVRADHLTFFILNLLLFFWYYLDFNNILGKSIRYQMLWGTCLIILANTRHFALGAWGIFFVYGVFLIFTENSKSKLKIAVSSVIIFFILIFSSSHYLMRIWETNKSNWIDDSSYVTKYINLQKDVPLAIKFKMLTNFQFNRLWENPNRTARFGDIKSLQDIPSSFFEDKFINKSSEEELSLLNKFFIFDKTKQVYSRDMNMIIEPEDKIKLSNYIHKKINYNNSFLPRLYGDMWADHWLYFSGKVGEDKKIFYKKMIMIAAIPFFILYLGLVILYVINGIKYAIREKVIKINHISAFLFLSVFVMFIFLTNFSMMVIGKNSIVKFGYIYAYYPLPLLLILSFFKRRKRLLNYMVFYSMILYIFALPLIIFF